MASLPAQRTLKWLKEQKIPFQVVERWNPFAKRRVDLFGGIDIVALMPGYVLGIQACRGGDHATRRTKLQAEPKLRAWCESGGKLEVWSWAKRGPRGKRKEWMLRREEIKGDEIATA